MRTLARPLRLAAAAVLALVAAAPAAGATGILAIGDFGVGGRSERRTGAAVERFAASHATDALVTLGDNDYTESPPAFRGNWRDSFGWAKASGVTVAGTLGNHDIRVDGGRYEFGPLDMPRRYYARTVGDVALFVVDSNRIGKPQRRWLARALGAATAPWTVVLLHHPAFSCGGYTGDARVRKRLVPIFERKGVDLVLAGHDHNYQRFARRRGVTYVVHGGGGQRLYPLRRCPGWFPTRVAGREARGWLYLRATPSDLRVQAIGRFGGVHDSFALHHIPLVGIY
jgi:3',5'-cyclic AMP phosphodiesterase CpdA